MTGSALYIYILSTFKRTDKSTQVFEAITDTIRDMRLRFQSNDFKAINTALIIGTIGNYSVALPSDFGHLIGSVMMKETVGDREYPPLMKISIERYNDLYGSRFNTNVGNRLTGNPMHFCIFNGNLLVGPPVDRTSYEFRFAYTQEDELDIDTSTDPVPFSQYRKCLRYGVLKELYLGLENYQEASNWGSLYETELAKIAENDYNNTKGSEPMSYNGI